MVRTGLARSRTLAQRLIRAGSVHVGQDTVTKASYAVAPGQHVRLTVDESHQWVGRGALKLLHALAVWGEGADPGRLQVTGRRCLDVGASTGGFTEVLLEHGAVAVTALDVGHDQLVPELANDPRVTDLPGTNIREVTPEQVGTFDLVVGDVSFISLTLVLPAVARVVRPGADLIFLVKPQFEVGREQVGRGGIVTAQSARGGALERVSDAALTLGWQVRGIERSPVRGTHGNTEYLLWLATDKAGMMSADGITARIRELLREDD
ncbi:TlyA family RNA methyltransferase [Ornithinimicrobium ciconiae]|uniref:TlyA family RNA methyltransferase n=2 Tax=Ornithinimicrobium ciconiae TaxID=2594265 RepID=A0A516GFS9_9MICO|nr:TlyA family RNA methyltransferase [Ornithinimicrobium ciconiae]